MILLLLSNLLFFFVISHKCSLDHTNAGVEDIKHFCRLQLLNEAENDMKNFADRGGCFPPRPRAEAPFPYSAYS